MRKAFRYLKPFALSVLAVVCLVFAQVQLELSLPDYMSGIVTYGIQYSGIKETLPKAVTEDTYQKMQVWMTEEEVPLLETAYRELSAGDPAYISRYPALSEGPVYVLESEENKDVPEKAFLITAMLKQPQIMEAMGMEDEDALYAALAEHPEMKEMILSGIDKQFEGYTAENLDGARRMMIKSEYAALGVNVEKLQSGYILNEGLIMLGIALLCSLTAALSGYISSRTATGAARNMRRDVFAKVESFSNEEFSRFSTASLITRTTNDIQQVQQLMNMMLRIVLFAPFMGLTSLFKVLRYRELAGILGWVILIILVLMVIILYFTMPRFRIVQQMVDRLNLVTREQLGGMLVIRAFNNQKTEEKRFDEVNTDLTKLNIFLNRVMAVISPLMSLLMSSVSVVIIWVGASHIDMGTMQIGDMLAFLQYAIHVLMSFMIVAMIFIMIPRSAVSAGRIFEVLETEPAIRDPEHPEHLPEENRTITFDHVCFRYPNAEQDVLHDISFTASPGETVAMIGSTGSGKSTLINLIPRFFDVTEGSIRFGDTDIRNVTQHELRQKIGYVPQKGVLFSGTVDENLRYADENATEETLQNALEVSQAEEFVSQLPEGRNEMISQGGTNVSGGQKQRLSIARALSKKSQVYIFDDTFSALDYQTDAKLREALNRMIRKTGATVFIVAQRISTIMHADKIIVLDEGKVAGMGTHKELLAGCSVYQEIAGSQLSREELGL